MKPIVFRTEIPLTKLEDILTTAIEGGSNYWYLLGADAMKIIDRYRFKNEPYIVSIMKALSAGKKIPIRDAEEEDKILGHLSISSIQNGVDKLLLDNRSEVIYLIGGEDCIADAGDADIIFQYFVLGELVFG